jgi:predicted permease
MSALARDVVFAWRLMRKSPGVTVAAVMALALGIGATTAIFSVVDGVLLRPLPFPQSQDLVAVHTGARSFNFFRAPLSYLEYKDLAATTRTLESVGGWMEGDLNLANTTTPERVIARWITPSLLPTLRVQPIRGRNIANDEIFKGHDRVVLIDWGLWQRRFSGRDDAIGQRMSLDGESYEIIGVLPRGFELTHHIDVWLPISEQMDGLMVRNSHRVTVVGRRRPGVSWAQVSADVHAVATMQITNYPALFPASMGWDMRQAPFLEEMVGQVRLPLLVLLGAVCFVLLIACANVANLLLARAATRQREMAVRTALGAGRARLIRQLLTESVLLALVGGGLGALVALWALDGLVGYGPVRLPRVREVGLDLRVLAFTAAVAITTGVVFGLVPAVTASRPDLNDALKNGARGSVGRGQLRSALVVAEVALSLVLLVGAGLMVRSFMRLSAVDPGYKPEHALMLRASLPLADNVVSEADRERYFSFFARATKRLQQLPGVSAAATISSLPLDGYGNDRIFEIEGGPTMFDGNHPDAQNRNVTPGWATALGIPLVEGRDITWQDDANAVRVVVVNRAFVRKFFPDGRAIGRRIHFGLTGDKNFEWTTIVGVVGDVHNFTLELPPEPVSYWPLAQTRDVQTMALVMRTPGDPRALEGAARAAMREVDAQQPIFDLQPVTEVIAQSLQQRRFTLLLMSLFGAVALLLAAVGIYAVIAYNVAQRTQEIGIRMALGARPRDVMTLVLRDGMSLVGAGLIIGGGAALALTRLASSLLFSVSPSDGTTYATIGLLLVGVALVAIWFPARRAMRIDPMLALRSE